jgi:uncharacterized RDD family membrane protein YckC
MNTPPLEGDEAAEAGFWIRVGAYMIDGALIGSVCMALRFALLDLLAVIVQVALSAGYYAVLPVINAGQTPGKMLAGLAIVRDDGTPLTYMHTGVRWVGYLVSGIAMGLGFALAAFTPRKRGVHDYMAGTRVVHVGDVAKGRKIAIIVFGVFSLFALILGILATAGSQS